MSADFVALYEKRIGRKLKERESGVLSELITFEVDSRMQFVRHCNDVLTGKKEVLEAKLDEAVELLREGKRQFMPSTTNSGVDDFLSNFKEGE